MGNSIPVYIVLDTREELDPQVTDNNTFQDYQTFVHSIIEGNSNIPSSSISDPKMLLHKALAGIYLDIKSKLKPLNPIFIYDKAIDRIDIYNKSSGSIVQYKEAIERIFCLFYKYLSNIRPGVCHLPLIDRLHYIHINSDLLQKLSNLVYLINNKFSSIYFQNKPYLKKIGILNALIDIGYLNPEELIYQSLKNFGTDASFINNTLILISKDPHEPKGPMCRFWHPTFPSVIFSPYYGNYISALNLIHELGHLIHYKFHLEKKQSQLEGIFEEFFAFLFELYWLSTNPWEIPKRFVSLLFWQRIWFIAVRQFQIFKFELSNLQYSANGLLSYEALTNNWISTSKEIFGILSPKEVWYSDFWLFLGQVLILPFRSLEYVLSALMVLYCIYNKVDLDKSIYIAQNLDELLLALDIHSIDKMLDKLTLNIKNMSQDITDIFIKLFRGLVE